MEDFAKLSQLGLIPEQTLEELRQRTMPQAPEVVPQKAVQPIESEIAAPVPPEMAISPEE